MCWWSVSDRWGVARQVSITTWSNENLLTDMFHDMDYIVDDVKEIEHAIRSRSTSSLWHSGENADRWGDWFRRRPLSAHAQCSSKHLAGQVAGIKKRCQCARLCPARRSGSRTRALCLRAKISFKLLTSHPPLPTDHPSQGSCCISLPSPCMPTAFASPSPAPAPRMLLPLQI